MPHPVMIVDDEQDYRHLVAWQLQRHGFDPVEAEDGGRCLTLLEEGFRGVILMDVRMPKIDGLEVTRRIRRFPATRPQPWIIALTAESSAEDKAKCLAAGMDDYLSKPIRIEGLDAALRRAPRRSGYTNAGA